MRLMSALGQVLLDHRKKGICERNCNISKYLESWIKSEKKDRIIQNELHHKLLSWFVPTSWWLDIRFLIFAQSYLWDGFFVCLIFNVQLFSFLFVVVQKIVCTLGLYKGENKWCGESRFRRLGDMYFRQPIWHGCQNPMFFRDQALFVWCGIEVHSVAVT